MQPTYDQARLALSEGRRLIRRQCRICHEPISFVLHQMVPHLFSCQCRPHDCSRLVKVGWEELKRFYP